MLTDPKAGVPAVKTLNSIFAQMKRILISHVLGRGYNFIQISRCLELVCINGGVFFL